MIQRELRHVQSLAGGSKILDVQIRRRGHRRVVGGEAHHAVEDGPHGPENPWGWVEGGLAQGTIFILGASFWGGQCENTRSSR